MYIIRVQKSELEIPAKKYTFLSNGKSVEFSYIKRKNKHIVCVSCAFGCNMGCIICRSGNFYYGHLTEEEMLDGILRIKKNEKIGDDKLLISFMGSGEPLFNVINVLHTIVSLKDIPNIYFSISISGYHSHLLEVFKENKFIKEIKPKIQFSLHSAIEEERKEIIPNSDSLYRVLLHLDKYKKEVGGDVEINYVVLDGINDSEEDADRLFFLINNRNYSLKINEYHQVNNKIRESRRKEEFIQRLKYWGLEFECYKTDGVDIDAACGQLQSRRIE